MFRTRDDAIKIDFQYGNCVWLVDDNYLDLDCVATSGLSHIYFFNHIPYDGQPHGITEDMILLYVDVKADKKAKTLTLTVTGGSLEQFLGKVYVLDFYPDEELKFDDAVTTREGADDSGKIEGKTAEGE